MDRGICKSCGKAILWAKTAGGKPIPLDGVPEKRFVIDGLRSTHVRLESTYQTHFASCPHAKEHRKAG